MKERDLWLSIGQDIGWDSVWSLHVDRAWYSKHALAEFPSLACGRFMVGFIAFALLLM